ncbi:Retrovirus-related Pol Polyprotein from transposon TNT 1-94 [Phytophthora megakarya]|uniref:Retrovirus-related Pol Polyprotein from transposon TNT 1-94 n=1 Tax=Phytophthora megakarya TaxID=4795 RepID=A0A225WA04_9STRA|nr:Retrovirus-related Pol Polyprotein from transposon TNT 1-94 [Phytophthora megakarya]
MLQAQLPHYLWEYAVRSTVFLRNRVLTKSDSTKTPFEKFWGRRPDLENVKAFGQRCVVLIPDEKRSMTYKFRPKKRSGVFLGCDPQRKGYFVYVTGRGHKVVHSRSVVFLEPPTNEPVKDVEGEDPMNADDDSDSNNSDIDDGDADDNEEDVSTTAAGQNSTSCRRCDNVTPLQPLRRSARIAGLTMGAAKATLDEIIQAPLNI